MKTRRTPICTARVDGGAQGEPAEKWKLCGRRAAGGAATFVNGEYEAFIALCPAHIKNPAAKMESNIAPTGLLGRIHAGVHASLFGDCLDVEFYPLSWWWWGIYPQRNSCLYLGPLRITVRQKT